MNRLFFELLKQIQAGKYQAGKALPPVGALMAEFEATEAEVRQALAELIYEGALERVRPQPPDQVQVPDYQLWGTLTGIHSITREAKKRGQAPGVEITNFSISKAWPSVARRLELEAEDQVVIMERLRQADGEPVAIEISYYPAKLYPGISEDMFTASGSGQSSFEVMEKKFGLKAVRATDELTVVPLEPREAGLLGLAPGTPVLLRFRISYSAQGTPIKSSRAVWKFKAGYEMGLDE
ncbi:MAG: GntR family transcriptional regulator [Chloroflexota bacterium]